MSYDGFRVERKGAVATVVLWLAREGTYIREAKDGKTAIFSVAGDVVDEEVAGILGVADPIKASTRDAVQELKVAAGAYDDRILSRCRLLLRRLGGTDVEHFGLTSRSGLRLRRGRATSIRARWRAPSSCCAPTS